MEFVSWKMLGTFAGSLSMVVLITQFTKELKFIKKIPTQLWSYIIAVIIMFPAYFFTGRLTLDSAILIPVNAVLVALAANGGFDAIEKIFSSTKKKTE